MNPKGIHQGKNSGGAPDIGSPMKVATSQALLEKMRSQSSFSRARVSNDNPYSETMIHTLKYRLVYPNYFETVEQDRQWTSKFVHWYNEEHFHSGPNFVTLVHNVIQIRIRPY